MSWSSQNICILIYKLLCILWAVFGWNVVQVYCTMQNSKIYLFKKSWWIKNPYFLLILNMLIDLTDSMYLFIFIFLLLLGLFDPKQLWGRSACIGQSQSQKIEKRTCFWYVYVCRILFCVWICYLRFSIEIRVF